MNKQQKLKILNRVLKELNKKFCNGKLSISKIVFFRRIPHKNKSCGVIQGYYDIHKKEIGIRGDISFIEQIDNLCHEFTHAYQDQIENCHRKGHNQKGWRFYQKLLKETDRIVKISV